MSGVMSSGVYLPSILRLPVRAILTFTNHIPDYFHMSLVTLSFILLSHTLGNTPTYQIMICHTGMFYLIN